MCLPDTTNDCDTRFDAMNRFPRIGKPFSKKKKIDKKLMLSVTLTFLSDIKMQHEFLSP